MPERQSTPGEMTTWRGDDAAPAAPPTRGDGQQAAAGPERNGNPPAPEAPAGSAPEPIAEQVADQIAAGSSAAEPGPAGPGEAPAVAVEPADGAGVVATGAPDAVPEPAGGQAAAPPPPAAPAPPAPGAAPAVPAPAAVPAGPAAPAVPDSSGSAGQAAAGPGGQDRPVTPAGQAPSAPPAASSGPQSPSAGSPAEPADTAVGPGVPAAEHAAHPNGASAAQAAARTTEQPDPARDTPPGAAQPDPARAGEAAAPATAPPGTNAAPGGAAGPAAPGAVEQSGPADAPAPVEPDPDEAAPDGPTVRAPLPGVDSPTVAVRVPPRPAAGAASRAPEVPAPNAWFAAGERTQVLPPVAPAAGAGSAGAPRVRAGGAAVESPTAQIPRPGLAGGTAGTPGGVAPAGPPAAAGASGPPSGPPHEPGAAEPAPRRRRGLLVTAVVLGVLALLYVGDLLLSSGTVPRGVTVAGVAVGGLAVEDAEQRLRAEIEPRTSGPIAVTAGEVRSEIDPATAGLDVDWAATVAQAGSQPLNPLTRLLSLFTEREVGVVTLTDDAAVRGALEQLGPVVDRPAVEGAVRFEGLDPVPVEPEAGQRLDVTAAVEVLVRDWASAGPVILPMTPLPPVTTAEDVAAAIERVARPAVAAPIVVEGEGGVSGTLTPADVAEALSFRPDADLGLLPELNPTVVADALRPQLAASERPGRDATLDFSSGAPVVVPSQDGRGVDYETTLRDLVPVLSQSGDRRVTATYADQPADVTTADLEQLGIQGLISEFTTGGFAADSGRNIRRAAEQINGMIVEPGETFSLNAATVPRNAANGYVEAGIISEGHPSRGIGGGVSQVATTLYNAAYFAGMVDVEHKEHSFYISRYPAGREATVFEGAIDLKFRNDSPTGVLIQTVWTPSSLTVRMYGTKRYEVTSTPGPRTNPTSPNTVTIPAGEPCSPSQGAPGFTITDTRTLREISTGQVRTETRTVRYNPSPIVMCEAG